MMSYGVREGKAAMFCARTPILVGNAMGRRETLPAEGVFGAKCVG